MTIEKQLLLPFPKQLKQVESIYTPHLCLQIEIQDSIARLFFQAPDGKRKELLAKGSLSEIREILEPVENLKCRRQDLCRGCRLFQGHYLIFRCYRSADRCFYKLKNN